MNRFLKWTAMTVAMAAGAALVYRWIGETQRRLERGLDRGERIADEAHAAVAHTERALGETAEAVHDVRRTMS